MWFIFPQLTGLGSSPTAQYYSLGSLEEAAAYLHHPVLGPRLRNCTQLALNIDGEPAKTIFGYPDWLKFRSCMTLFDRVAPQDLFAQALNKYFDGEADSLTLAALEESAGNQPDRNSSSLS